MVYLVWQPDFCGDVIGGQFVKAMFTSEADAKAYIKLFPEGLLEMSTIETEDIHEYVY